MTFELTAADFPSLRKEDVLLLQNLFFHKYGEEHGSLLLDIFTGHQRAQCKLVIDTD